MPSEVGDEGVLVRPISPSPLGSPIVGTVVEWNGYVAKGDVGMTALYGVLSLAEVLSVGGVSRAKTAGKVAIGAGVKEATKETASTAAKNNIQKVKDNIVEWLGDDFRFIKNKHDDIVLVSADNTRRVRLDLNEPYPHKNPHMHAEVKINGDWTEERVFPYDVPPE